MAYERDITAEDQVFFDTDRVLRYAVFQGNPTAEEIAAGDAVPEDITGWSLAWTLRRTPKSQTALIEKATGGSGITITGSYNVDPSINTQRVEVLIEDTDTYDPDASPEVNVKPSTSYAYALKRTDDGAESILAFGAFTLLQAAAWE